MQQKEYVIQARQGGGTWRDVDTYSLSNCAWSEPMEEWVPLVQNELEIWKKIKTKNHPDVEMRVILRTTTKQENVVIDETGKVCEDVQSL